MTARAVARLLPAGGPTARGAPPPRRGGPARGGGGALRRYRERVVMIFQDPRAHVNPVRRIGDFMTEGLRLHDVPRDEAVRRSVEALRDVGIEDGARRLEQYPPALSGGLLQRVMIATI